MVPTKEEMDALERHVSGQLRDIRQSRQLTETVGVHGPTVLSLIAAVRELENAWDEGFEQALLWARDALPVPPVNPYRQPKGPTK